jgi:hypothetical protein
MRKIIGIALVIIVLLPATALWQSCTGALTPEDIVTRAHWTMNAVGSYHMANHYSISSSDTGSVDELYLDVDFSVPDRYRITHKESGVTAELTIVIGDEYYVAIESYDSDTQGYLGAFSYAILQTIKRESFFDVLKSITDIEELPDEDIDGYDCYHLTAAWDKERVLNDYDDNLQQQRRDAELPELSEDEMAEMIENLSDLLEDVSIEFGLWIDKDTPYIRKMAVKQKQSIETDGNTVEYVTYEVMEFSMINEPITIEPPLDEGGNLQAGWIKDDY